LYYSTSLARFGFRFTALEIAILYALGNRHGLASDIESQRGKHIETSRKYE
jgi:hypothetical protein